MRNLYERLLEGKKLILDIEEKEYPATVKNLKTTLKYTNWVDDLTLGECNIIHRIFYSPHTPFSGTNIHNLFERR